MLVDIEGLIENSVVEVGADLGLQQRERILEKRDSLERSILVGSLVLKQDELVVHRHGLDDGVDRGFYNFRDVVLCRHRHDTETSGRKCGDESKRAEKSISRDSLVKTQGELARHVLGERCEGEVVDLARIAGEVLSIEVEEVIHLFFESIEVEISIIVNVVFGDRRDVRGIEEVELHHISDSAIRRSQRRCLQLSGGRKFSSDECKHAVDRHTLVTRHSHVHVGAVHALDVVIDYVGRFSVGIQNLEAESVVGHDIDPRVVAI